MIENTLKELGMPPFHPHPVLKTGMAQTLASAVWPYRRSPESSPIHTVSLADEDQLVIVEDRPPSWKPGDRIAVLVHGLAGHHEANYMVRVSRKLVKSGILAFRVNLRGCGIGFGLAKQPYHSGRSEDLREVLLWVQSRFPKSPVTQIGFSLGANITLKLAGEDGSHPTGNLDSFVSVSSPLDLGATAEHLKKSHRKFFDRFFVLRLRYDILRHHRRFPELPAADLPFNMALTDLDEYYTAPRSGFRNSLDYYEKCSSGPWVSSIQIPGLILCAQDDPIIDAKTYHSLKIPSQVDQIITSTGGHVGFIGKTAEPNEYQWMDSLIARWVAKIAQNRPQRTQKDQEKENI